MSRTATITLFKFDELSDEAKEKARDWYRGCEPWGWQSEWWNSAQAFSERFDVINIREADYTNGIVTVDTKMDADDRELSGLRAWKWLQNHGWFDRAREEVKGTCSLTGYCGDAPFFDPIHEYYRKPLQVPTLEQVFYECAQKWMQEARADMEYAYSDEGVDESIEANDYEFLEDGTRA